MHPHTVIDNQKSTETSLDFGVSQGSVLGPVLVFLKVLCWALYWCFSRFQTGPCTVFFSRFCAGPCTGVSQHSVLGPVLLFLEVLCWALYCYLCIHNLHASSKSTLFVMKCSKTKHKHSICHEMFTDNTQLKHS